MSSILRRMQRKVARKRADYSPATQPTQILGDGGYRTLRSTQGWVLISARRVRAQQKMAALLDHAMPLRAKKPRKVWHKATPVPPSTDTRQQRRARQRIGIHGNAA